MMALWTIKLPPWPGANFKDISPEEVLIEYDGPLTFTFRDQVGGLMLAHLLVGDDAQRRFLVAPTTTSLVEQLKAGSISVRGALDQALVWLIDVDPQGHVINTWSTSLTSLPADVLPAADVRI